MGLVAGSGCKGWRRRAMIEGDGWYGRGVGGGGCICGGGCRGGEEALEEVVGIEIGER